MKTISPSQSHDSSFIDSVLMDGSRTGIVVASDQLYVLVNRSKKKFQHRVLQEKIITNHVGFLLPPNSFIYEGFNRKIVQLVEAGLMQRYVAEHTGDYKEPEEEDGDPVVLNLDHLGIGFEICLLFLTIAFAVFIFEFICVRLTRC